MRTFNLRERIRVEIWHNFLSSPIAYLNSSANEKLWSHFEQLFRTVLLADEWNYICLQVGHDFDGLECSCWWRKTSGTVVELNKESLRIAHERKMFSYWLRTKYQAGAVKSYGRYGSLWLSTQGGPPGTTSM